MTPEILLKAYVQYQSEEALRELVASTLDEVYSTSLRIVRGTPHLAEEIVVRVYLGLAHKASRLDENVVLASWLREHTCKMAVTVLHAEDRTVDRDALKREKTLSVPSVVQPAPEGLATRICYSIFLSAPRRKGFQLFALEDWWPDWIRRRHFVGAAVCVLAFIIWWSNPFHRRNRIIESQGPLLAPSSFAQLASPDEGGPSTIGDIANTNVGINPKQK